MLNTADQASSVEGYHPRWAQCASPGPLNAYVNSSNIAAAAVASGNDTNSTLPSELMVQSCSYDKQDNETALKISWHGSIAVLECDDCCVRWYVTIDGQECVGPGPIDGAVVQDLSGSEYDISRPASIVGICYGTAAQPLGPGTHRVELRVGPCSDAREDSTDDVPPPSHTLTGYNSVSRFLIEEVPRSSQACPSELVQPRR